MQRTSITLTEQQVQALQQLSQQTGLRFSELLRRAVDQYLASQQQAKLLRGKP